MNRVDLENVVQTVQGRLSAAGTPAGGVTIGERNSTVALFVGTDLPGHDVLDLLMTQIEGHLHHLEETGLVGLCQGLSLNAFLLGFECGRRSA